eukprot:c24005_g1_i1 orf=208-1272(+)
MAQNCKPIPHLCHQSTLELNLTVLQRMDTHVEDILMTAGHVTLYEFNLDVNQWSRKDVEGSLFVVKRRTKPRFQFIVMNRRNTENLVEDLLDDFEFEVQVPYLLYRNAAQDVNGIWFYNSRECEEVAKLFSRILSAYAKVPPKSKVFSAQSTEFQELEAVPTAATVDGPLEPPSTSTSVEVTDDPLERFFSNALHLKTQEPITSSVVRQMSPVLPSSFQLSSGNSAAFAPVLTAPLPQSSLVSSCTNHPAADIVSSNPGVLLKPSFFVPPPLTPTTVTTLPPPLPPLQLSLGAPLLQPFPPPTPPPSLAPISTLSHGPILNRERVRDALHRLIQNDSFIDMVYQELVKAHKMSI